MNDSHSILAALVPVIVLLAFGVVAAIGSRALRLSPIVGYLALGAGLSATGADLLRNGDAVATLAELGVVFLLFDIGLHFSLTHVREQARDIFGFGPLQVVFGTLVLALPAYLVFDLSVVAALLVGATLSLSSTAVVARLISERHQQNCPVGLTATAILVFQDVAAIFLLIVAGAFSSGEAMLPAIGSALLKAAGAFAVSVLLARLVVRPLFSLVARTRNDELFTAMALLVALGAGWLTGSIGLSLTLGAFLGGMIIAETPYRAVIQAEIKPFRGLLLSFFFISVGLSLNTAILLREWPAVLGIAVALFLLKGISNAAASLVFKWSVPGSTQLALLLAQGSEFALVIFSLPAVREMVGADTSAVLIAAVALTLAATPTVAEAGRTLAGRMRRKKSSAQLQVGIDPELQPRGSEAPVFIAGMNRLGRDVADALNEFKIAYDAIESDERLLSDAIADGYATAYGDIADPKVWEPMDLHARRIIVLAAPAIEVSRDLRTIALERYPGLLRIAAVRDNAAAAQFEALGMRAVLATDATGGRAVAIAVLQAMGIDHSALDAFARRGLQGATVVAASAQVEPA